MKAAILGMGAMGQIHKQVYESLGIEVIIYDPKQWPFEYAAETISMVDIVSICSPDNFHAEQIIAAFKMGKHVFCEKPLCHTRQEFEAIKAAYNKECALGMNFPLRWHKPFVEAKQRLPDFGDIKYVHAHYEYGRLHKMNGWRGNMDYSVVMGGGIHMIDLLVWLGFDLVPDMSHRDDLTSVALFDSERTLMVLTCDFRKSEGHARRLWIEGSKDSLYIDDQLPTDKGRALREFLYCQRQGLHDPLMAIEDVPTPEEIFRVHEIGLSL